MEVTNSLDPKEEDGMDIQFRVKMETNLASPDKEKREKAMSRLCLWLTSLKDVKEDGLVKVWKGLFFCLLHAEEATLQEDLIERMGYLLERLDVKQSLLFFKGFLTALRWEWSSFDKDCVDRFYLLLGRCIFHMFAVLQKSAWDTEVVCNFMNALVERALLAEDGVLGDDVTVGIMGVFLDELKHYFPIPTGVIEALLEPFWMMLAKGSESNPVAKSISEKVFLPLMDHGYRFLISQKGEYKVGQEVSCLGAVALSLSFSIQRKSSSMLSSASELNTIQLKLIQEQFTALERLVVQYQHPSCESSGQNCTMSNVQTESQCNGDVLNSLADTGEEMQSSSISPLQFLVTRTFGRRSKRNQKLAFSPHTVDSVYAKEDESLQEKLGNAPEDLLSQRSDAERGAMKDNLISLSQNEELQKGRTFEKVLSSDMAQLNSDSGEIIGVDGGPSKQEAAASKEGENKNGLIAAIQDDGVSMEDPVISNLNKRFESIAEQSPSISSPNVVLCTPLAPSPINTSGRKRKSWRCSPVDSLDGSPTSTKENNVVPQDADASLIDTIYTKKAKKVHFSLQHNIVWKPSTPLPPHSVRVPPSATPRGSALKKGVPPGPIVDSSVTPLSASKRKKKKKATPKKTPSAHSRSPKSLKNTGKVIKPAKRGHLSPR